MGINREGEYLTSFKRQIRDIFIYLNQQVLGGFHKADVRWMSGCTMMSETGLCPQELTV
jgi:hypothetical protein